MKNRNGFLRNRSTTLQILTISRTIEGVREKNLEETLLVVDFSKAFDSIQRAKMGKIHLAYGLPNVTVTAIMTLYRYTKIKVHTRNGNTDFFDIVVRVVQADILAP